MLYKNTKYTLDEYPLENFSEARCSFEFLYSNFLKEIVDKRENDLKNNLYSKNFQLNYSTYKEINSWEDFTTTKYNDLDFGSSYFYKNTLNKLQKLETVTESRIQENKKSLDFVANRLSDFLYQQENIVVNDYSAIEVLSDFDISSSELHQKLLKLSELIPINLEDFYYQELNLDDVILHRLAQSIETCVENIKQDTLLLSHIKALSKLIKKSLSKSLLNKRDFFRKINSFHFKNLDDYHSISAIA
ncbi:Hypothetical protein KQS_00870 [Flavobacterium indicum GPTSA100-9 = DSM 17447]|uniref:Uncharacterized protein n=1 Tax=Flavobacterium indicum (strain DSM 17447 / CIP 109464 / GPTSA100-9) TaxID=1094466 RepID=H8XNQ6_FLAIG|nr:hypothetical protein [Flavobacterium indicum]CCG52173.1 Hypothetical protein KQS_00870 [Flavobacterium indicum GPTSA100-9 = DSM 17447]